MPLAYSLALLALSRTAKLRKGGTVLIHSAAGPVGQACIVLAQHIGARIFATAGTSAKMSFRHNHSGIPSEHIFSSRTPEFRDGILAATRRKGVDVIVNSLSSELMTETWALSASFGRFVDIGKKDALLDNYLPMSPFNRNVTYSGIDLHSLHQHHGDALKEIFSEFVNLVQNGVAVPIKSVTAFPISQFPAALRKIKSGDAQGKIVVTLGQDESVLAENDLRPSKVSLGPEGTYLITGGTRGIGLNLAYWLIEHGACNIVLLGRSGSEGEEVQKLLKQYQASRVTIRALACNVGSREELQRAP